MRVVTTNTRSCVRATNKIRSETYTVLGDVININVISKGELNLNTVCKSIITNSTTLTGVCVAAVLLMVIVAVGIHLYLVCIFCNYAFPPIIQIGEVSFKRQNRNSCSCRMHRANSGILFLYQERAGDALSSQGMKQTKLLNIAYEIPERNQHQETQYVGLDGTQDLPYVNSVPEPDYLEPVTQDDSDYDYIQTNHHFLGQRL